MKIHPLVVLLGLVAAALVAGSIFRYPLVLDDPFITYRYAHNLVAGQGFVYNPGEHVLSTTTPLYALVLAAFGMVLADIPAVGFWLSVVGLAVCAWSLYLIGVQLDRRAAGVVAALVTLIAPALVLTWGLETGLYLALALGAFTMYLRGRFTLAFALLALLTLTRNDGILLSGIIGAHFIWTQVQTTRINPREPDGNVDSRVVHADTLSEAENLSLANAEQISHLQAHLGRDSSSRRTLLEMTNTLLPFAVFAAILVPWFVFAWWWFGTPFPFTLTAKIAQAQSGLWQPFGPGALAWLRDWIAGNIVFAVSALAGLAVCLRARSRVLLLVLWVFAHFTGYALLGVAFYGWYTAPLIPVLALLAGMGVEGAGRWLAARFKQSYVTPALVVIALAALLLVEWQGDFAAGMATPSPKSVAYAQAGEWLAQNTPTGSSVDALEVGIIGYYDRRRTVDFVGLVDPARIPFVRTSQFAAGVRQAAADYLIAIPTDTWLNIDPWFTVLYQKVHEIRVNGFYSGKPLVIYRRVDSGRAVAETIDVKGSFDHQADLVAVDLFTRTVAPGQVLPVILHLRSGPMEGDKFTLQLLGAGDKILAQSDVVYPPRPNAAPARFVDHLAVSIPRTTPPGQYHLILALYNPERQERASLYDPNGNEAGDFVSLGDITIR